MMWFRILGLVLALAVYIVPAWAERPLKQSTARTIIVGPYLDETDGISTEESLTVANIDADLYKDDATEISISLTASGGDNDSVHVDNGYYSLELTVGDTDTLGYLRISLNISGAMPIWEDFVVLTANAYDTLYSSDSWDVNVTAIEGSDPTDTLGVAQTGDSFARIGADGASLGDLGGMSTAMKAEVKAEAAQALTDFGPNTVTPPTAVQNRQEMDSNSTQLGAIVEDTGTTLPGEHAALPTAVENRQEMDSNSTQLGAIVEDTGTTIPALLITSLTDIHLDHLFNTAYDPTSKPGAADSWANVLVENDGGVPRYTVNALEQAPSGTGGDATAANQTTIIDDIAALNDPDVAAIVTGVLAGVIEGSIDLQTAVNRILAVTANPFDASGTDPMVFIYRNAADDADVITLTIDEEVTERSIAVP